jgi:hypothetical protein
MARKVKKIFRLWPLAFQLCASRLKRSLISPSFAPRSARPGIGSPEFAIGRIISHLSALRQKTSTNSQIPLIRRPVPGASPAPPGVRPGAGSSPNGRRESALTCGNPSGWWNRDGIRHACRGAICRSRRMNGTKPQSNSAHMSGRLSTSCVRRSGGRTAPKRLLVMPTNAGIQRFGAALDSRLRGNDKAAWLPHPAREPSSGQLRWPPSPRGRRASQREKTRAL